MECFRKMNSRRLKIHRFQTGGIFTPLAGMAGPPPEAPQQPVHAGRIAALFEGDCTRFGTVRLNRSIGWAGVMKKAPSAAGRRVNELSPPKDRKGVDVMKAKLLALAVGGAMLASAGTAYADAVVSAGPKARTPTTAEPQMKAAPAMKAAGQGRRPLVLTEPQMDKITAGMNSAGHRTNLTGGKGDDIY
jgi:hypothetical protein